MHGRYWFALVAVGLTFAVASHAEQPRPQQPASGHTNAAEDKPAPKPPPPPVARLPVVEPPTTRLQESADAEGQDHEDPWWRWPFNSNFWIAIFTLVLMVVSLWQGFQIKAGEKLTVAALRSAQRQARAATRSAKASEKVAEHTAAALAEAAKSSDAMVQQNLITERAQRAWISHKGFDSERQFIAQTGGKLLPAGIHFWSEWINTGQLPAFGCRFRNQHHFFERSLTLRPLDDRVDDDTPPVVIGPGQPRASGDHMLTQRQVEDWKAGRWRLIFFTRVSYHLTPEDAEKRTNQKFTEVTFEATWTGETLDERGGVGDLVAYRAFGHRSNMT